MVLWRIARGSTLRTWNQLFRPSSLRRSSASLSSLLWVRCCSTPTSELPTSARLPACIWSSPRGPHRTSPSPILSERRHRRLARRLITKSWRPTLVFVGCPHPGAMLRRGRRLKNAPHHDAVLHDVIAVVAPSPEAAQGRREFVDQWGHGSGYVGRKLS
jgi:hypothetical protein